MRGKVLKDTNAGDGIVFVNEGQRPFSLQQHWKSATPPKIGGVVDVEFNAAGDLIAVSVVDETTLAKEQALKTLNVMGEYGKEGANVLLARVSPSVLGSLVVLAIAWIFLSAVNVNISKGFAASATFYEILKLVNQGGEMSSLANIYGSAGIYGFLMWVCLFAPLATHFHENKNLPLTYCAPLVFMASICISIYFTVQNQISNASAMSRQILGNMVDKLITEQINMAMKAISFGFGFYLSFIVAIYLAAIGIKKYLANKAL
jgi:hypothetical protein